MERSLTIARVANYSAAHYVDRKLCILLTAQSLAATGMVRVVIRDHSDDTSFKRGTLLVDCGNEDLVDSGNTALSVPVDESWYVIEPDESIIFINSEGSMDSPSVFHIWLI